MSAHEVHVKFAGRIVMVGFGSIGQGVLPLILRHIGTSADRITIVTAEDKGNSDARELPRGSAALLERRRFLVEFVSGCFERGAHSIGARTRRAVSGYLHRAV